MHYREYIRFTEIGTLFIFTAFLINPVLSPYIRGLGFDEFQIGLIFSLYPLSIILFSPVMGRLSDAVGRRFIILTGIVMQIAAMLLYIADGSYIVISLARILNATGYVTVILTVLAKIEDSVDSKSRGRYVGWSLSIEYVSRMVAPILGGIVADMLFITAPFVLSIILLAVLSFYFVRQKTRRSGRVSRGDFNPLKEIREFLSEKALRGMAAMGIVMHASMPVTNVFLPLLLIDKFGASFTLVGMAFFAMGALHLLQFFFGSLSDRFGSKHVLLPGTLLFGICMVLASAAGSYYTLLIILLFLGMGGAMWNIAAYSIMSDIGESLKKEGQVVMTYASIAKTGAFASFVLSGLVAQYYGIEMLFLLSGILIIAGTLGVSAYWRGQRMC
jgi:MFS family permease